MKPRAWINTLALLCLVTCCRFDSVSAAELTTNLPPALSTPPSTGMLEVLLRMIGALLVVFGLFLGGIWLFKRTRLFTLYQGGPSELRVLESRSIGHRNSLVVVGYHEQRFLLSVSATGAHLVTNLPDAAPESEKPVTATVRPSFAEQLTALVRKA